MVPAHRRVIHFDYSDAELSGIRLGGGSGVERADGINNSLLLIVTNFGVDGQSEDFCGGKFRMGEVTRLVPEIF